MEYLLNMNDYDDGFCDNGFYDNIMIDINENQVEEYYNYETKYNKLKNEYNILKNEMKEKNKYIIQKFKEYEKKINNTSQRIRSIQYNYNDISTKKKEKRILIHDIKKFKKEKSEILSKKAIEIDKQNILNYIKKIVFLFCFWIFYLCISVGLIYLTLNNIFNCVSIIIMLIGLLISLFYTETGFFIRYIFYHPVHNFVDSNDGILHMKQLYIEDGRVKQRFILSETIKNEATIINKLYEIDKSKSYDLISDLIIFFNDFEMIHISSSLKSLRKSTKDFSINGLIQRIRIMHWDILDVSNSGRKEIDLCNYINNLNNRIINILRNYDNIIFKSSINELLMGYNDFISQLYVKKYINITKLIELQSEPYYECGYKYKYNECDCTIKITKDFK